MLLFPLYCLAYLGILPDFLNEDRDVITFEHTNTMWPNVATLSGVIDLLEKDLGRTGAIKKA